MIVFPKSTVFNKRISKQKFYDKISVSSSLERLFVEDIDAIFWRNKLSVDTLNVSKGNNVTEIELIEILLKKEEINKNIIEVIDREIPYHLVFVLRYKEMGQIWISYKEDSKSREGKFKVDSYYKTKWQTLEELSLEIDGLNLDTIYENFILQVAGGRIESIVNSENITVKEAIDRNKEIEKLEISINKLETKIRNEKQFNRQVKLKGEVRKLKTELYNFKKHMEDANEETKDGKR